MKTKKSKILALTLAIIMCIDCFNIGSPIKNVYAAVDTLSAYNTYIYNNGQPYDLTAVIGTGNCGAFLTVYDANNNYPCYIIWGGNVNNTLNVSIGDPNSSIFYRITSDNTGIFLNNGYVFGYGYATQLTCSNGYAVLFIPQASWDKLTNASLSILQSTPYIPNAALENINNADAEQLSTLDTYLKSKDSSATLSANTIYFCNSAGSQQSACSGSGTCTNTNRICSNLGDLTSNYTYKINGSGNISLYVPSVGTTINASINVNSTINWNGLLRYQSNAATNCTDSVKTNATYFWFNSSMTSVTNIPLLNNKTNHKTGTTKTYTKKDVATHTVITKCSGCDAVLSTTTENHSWNNEVITKEATCTKPGVKTYTCTECNETKTEDIPALGHDYKQERVEATGTEDGYIHNVCSRCGDIVVLAILPATGTAQPTSDPTTTESTGTTQPTSDPTNKPTTESTNNDINEYTDIYDLFEAFKTDISGLFNGQNTYEFTYDGQRFKVVNENNTYKVYKYDGFDKWIEIPNAANKTANSYGFITIKNSDGTTSIYVVKSKSMRVKIKRVSSTKKKKLNIRIKKMTNVSGFQFQVATNKKFTKNKKTKNISLKKLSKKKWKYTFSKLKSKKKYYIRVRAYEKVKNKKVYKAWSKIKNIKVK